MSVLVVHREPPVDVLRRATEPPYPFVTCDDGYVEQYGLCNDLAHEGTFALLFPVLGDVGGEPTWDVRVPAYRNARLMNMSDLRQLVADGHDIGCHTLTHPRRWGWHNAKREVFDCKDALENIFGREVKHFAYPYGVATPEQCEIVAQAGFRYAYITGRGATRSSLAVYGDPLLIGRERP